MKKNVQADTDAALFIKKKMPRHVAIVMDGNGRWAEARQQPRIEGHRQGAKAVQKTIQTAIKHHIEVLTLWAFSTDNWHRPQAEIDYLFKLLLTTLKKQIARLQESDIQLRVIGDKNQLSKELQEAISQAETISQHHTGLKLIVALNYSGKWDILQAVKKITRAVLQGKVNPEMIDETTFSQYLMNADLPPPDLFIRTSGELRLSNFYLWQLAFTELYFTNTLWPDFDETCFEAALIAYQKRHRRFGGLINGLSQAELDEL